MTPNRDLGTSSAHPPHPPPASRAPTAAAANQPVATSRFTKSDWRQLRKLGPVRNGDVRTRAALGPASVKIDYYDRMLRDASPNPADPAVTRRVLTLMLASDY
jgi:hypothetical protein